MGLQELQRQVNGDRAKEHLTTVYCKDSHRKHTERKTKRWETKIRREDGWMNALGVARCRPKRGGSRGSRSRPVISCADFTGGKQPRPESELVEAEEDEKS